MNTNTVKDFLGVLTDKGVRSVLWKNISELEDGLSGKKDLDLLIPEADWRQARCILIEYGFVEAENYVATFPNVYHYFGLMGENIIHLNIYTRIMTGESQTKAYDIPLMDSILKSSGYYFNKKILTPSPNLSLYIYLVRYFLKISSVPSFVRYCLDKDDYKKELAVILSSDIDLEENYFCLCGVENKELIKVFDEKPSLHKLFYALKMRFKFSVFSRFGILKSILIRYKQFFKRIINKTFLKRKKNLIHQGVIIALTGLDGAGKSSSVQVLSKWFSKYFDCENIHLGRPKPILFTLPIRLGLALKNIIRPKQNEAFSTPDNTTNIRESSLIEAIRYTALAFERLAVMKKALRLRAAGYIVILDRYPCQSIGKMDGRRVVSLGKSKIIRKLASLETWIYQNMPIADLLLKLEVPVEVALERNRMRDKEGKETDDEIIYRHNFNQNLEYNSHQTVSIDMNRPINETMADIKRHSWSILN